MLHDPANGDGAFQRIVESSPDAVLVHHEREVRYANKAAISLFRAEDANQLLGRSLFELFDPRYHHLFRNGNGAKKGVIRQEVVAVDGMVIDVDVTAAAVIFGGAPATALLLRDVSTTSRLKNRLRAVEERFSLILRASHDAVWEWDMAKGTVWSSHTAGEFLDERNPELIRSFDASIAVIHDDDRPRVLSSLKSAVQSDAEYWTEKYRIGRDNGTVTHIVNRAYVVRQSGRAVRMVGAITDVTELWKAQEDREALAKLLEQSNRIAGLGRLSATVAHEFNNVLMSIQPYAEIIQRKGHDPVAVQKAATAIVQGVHRGKRITEEILRFARPVEPTLAPLVLDEWLSHFAQDVRAMNIPAVDFRIHPGAAGISVMADARQLEQVLWNLVVNARDAMPEGGRLTLSTGRCASCPAACDLLAADQLAPFACVRVADTGCGIPEEAFNKIFEPLYTTKKNGTGLGLAVAHQIATRHGGYLFARSQMGEGTTFTLLLRTADPISL